MRALIFSDLHLHSWKLESGERMSKKLKAQQKALSMLVARAEAWRPDYVIFCGDFYHAHGMSTAEVSSVAYNFLTRLREVAPRIVLLVGNHDRPYKGETLHGMEWMKKYGTVVEPEQVYEIDVGAFLSYTENKEQLDKVFNTQANHVFIHQGVKGVPVGSGRVLDEIFDPTIATTKQRVFTGHYHSHQNVGNITVVGSLIQLTWADAGQPRGWLEYDATFGQMTHVDSGAPRYLLCNTLQEAQQARAGDHVRLLFEGAEDVATELRQDGKVVDFTPVAITPDVHVKSTDLNALLLDYEKDLSPTYVDVGRKLRS